MNPFSTMKSWRLLLAWIPIRPHSASGRPERGTPELSVESGKEDLRLKADSCSAVSFLRPKNCIFFANWSSQFIPRSCQLWVDG